MKDNASEITKMKFYLMVPNVEKEVEKKFVRYLEAVLNIQYNNSLIDDSVIDDNPIISRIKELHSKGINTQLVNVGMGMINSYDNKLLNNGSKYSDYVRVRSIEDDSKELTKSYPNNMGFGIAAIILMCTAILGVALGSLLFIILN